MSAPQDHVATGAWRPPTIALVGRPNVGKSTLFNRLVGFRSAITYGTPGVTRDRHDELTEMHFHKVRLVDTGGFEPTETQGMLPLMRRQAEMAIAEADAVVFMVSARDGVMPADEEIAQVLRRTEKPVFVAANKSDTVQLDVDAMAFYSLGVEEVFAIAAEHNRGVLDLTDAIIRALGALGLFAGEPDGDLPLVEVEHVRGGVVDRIRVCFVGKPNVGKSTMVNQLLGKERVITADQPGTTRDAIDIEFKFHDAPYTLIDTAGLRRKRSVHDAIEQFSVSQAVRAIERSHVAVLVLDAMQPLSDQDSKIAALIQDRGRACVVAINKWDAIEKDTHTARTYELDLERHLPFLEHIPKVTVSAKSGQRVDKLFDTVQAVFDNFNRRVPTHKFNKWLMALQERHQPPTYRARKLKMHYGAQLSVRPPKFVIIVNFPQAISAAYERFLLAQIREEWAFIGSPIRLELKKKAQRKRKFADRSAVPGTELSTGDDDLDAVLRQDADDPEVLALQAALLAMPDDDELDGEWDDADDDAD